MRLEVLDKLPCTVNLWSKRKINCSWQKSKTTNRKYSYPSWNVTVPPLHFCSTYELWQYHFLFRYTAHQHGKTKNNSLRLYFQAYSQCTLSVPTPRAPSAHSQVCCNTLGGSFTNGLASFPRHYEFIPLNTGRIVVRVGRSPAEPRTFNQKYAPYNVHPTCY